MKNFPWIRAGLFISVSPLLLAFIAALFQGGSMWNEGSGPGAIIWFLFFTTPMGLCLIIIGLLMKVFFKRK